MPWYEVCEVATVSLDDSGSVIYYETRLDTKAYSALYSYGMRDFLRRDYWRSKRKKHCATVELLFKPDATRRDRDPGYIAGRYQVVLSRELHKARRVRAGDDREALILSGRLGFRYVPPQLRKVNRYRDILVSLRRAWAPDGGQAAETHLDAIDAVLATIDELAARWLIQPLVAHERLELRQDDVFHQVRALLGPGPSKLMQRLLVDGDD
jgi:hypothetical protein